MFHVKNRIVEMFFDIWEYWKNFDSFFTKLINQSLESNFQDLKERTHKALAEVVKKLWSNEVKMYLMKMAHKVSKYLSFLYKSIPRKTAALIEAQEGYTKYQAVIWNNLYHSINDCFFFSSYTYLLDSKSTDYPGKIKNSLPFLIETRGFQFFALKLANVDACAQSSISLDLIAPWAYTVRVCRKNK